MLDFILKNIHEYEAYCYEPVSDGYRITALTETLIYQTMVVGINEITEKTWEEYYTRISMYEKLFGTFLFSPADNNGLRQPRPITEEDIYKHIGLHTNASSLTKPQFIKRAANRHYRDSSKDITNYLKEIDA